MIWTQADSAKAQYEAVSRTTPFKSGTFVIRTVASEEVPIGSIGRVISPAVGYEGLKCCPSVVWQNVYGGQFTDPNHMRLATDEEVEEFRKKLTT